MRALLAFDKFKDSMTAADACATAAAALRGCRPAWTLDPCPLADGGEGFVEILTTAARGELRSVEVTGPRGTLVSARYGIVAGANVPAAARQHLGIPETGTIGLVEMAAASGLALLRNDERDIWRTTTFGTGELIRAAAGEGVDAIVIGVGGSATNDLGLGALLALGLDAGPDAARHRGAPIGWHLISTLAGSPASLPPLFIACDVTNPLLGPRGAAAVYGPQKGLLAGDAEKLDREGARIAGLLCGRFGKPADVVDQPGAGAAGGIAFGLMVAADARLVPGFDFVSAWLDLESRLAAADIVLTGEGRFDESSLNGKGPGALAARALSLGKQVHVFAGAVSGTSNTPQLLLHAITPAAVPLPQALREGPDNLGRCVSTVFR